MTTCGICNMTVSDKQCTYMDSNFASLTFLEPICLLINAVGWQVTKYKIHEACSKIYGKQNIL